jgi:hypothetical protein
VLNVSELRPVDEAHPVATVPDAPGQFESERVAEGVAGTNEPAKEPFVKAIFVDVAEPIIVKADGWVQWVGAPGGELQVISN